jgi:hypothetical protein
MRRHPLREGGSATARRAGRVIIILTSSACSTSGRGERGRKETTCCPIKGAKTRARARPGLTGSDQARQKGKSRRPGEARRPLPNAESVCRLCPRQRTRPSGRWSRKIGSTVFDVVPVREPAAALLERLTLAWIRNVRMTVQTVDTEKQRPRPRLASSASVTCHHAAAGQEAESRSYVAAWP